MNHHCQRERLSISAIKFCSQIVPNANKKSPCKAHKYKLCRDLHFYSNSSQRKYHQIKNADFMRHSTASVSSNVTLFISFSKTLVAN